MTNDPRDVEAAVRAYCVAHAVSRDIFDQTGLSPDRSTILAARYAREAAEKRTVEGDLSPEELDEARIGEAQKRGHDAAGAFYYYRELVRTGWTPPKVEGVDPDLVAVREIAARVVERETVGIVHPYARDIRAGKKDDSTEVQIARAVLAYLKGEVE